MVLSTVFENREYMAGEVDCGFCLLFKSSLNPLKESEMSQPPKAYRETFEYTRKSLTDAPRVKVS